MNQLNEEKNKNQKLLEQLSIEQKKVEELNEKIKLYENNNNLEKIKELEEMINSLKSEINDLKKIADKNENTTIKSENEIMQFILHLLMKKFKGQYLVKIQILLIKLKKKYIMNILNIKNIILISQLMEIK